VHKDGESAAKILLAERVDGKEHQSVGRSDAGTAAAAASATATGSVHPKAGLRI
jgi:hypothetical protein